MAAGKDRRNWLAGNALGRVHAMRSCFGIAGTWLVCGAAVGYGAASGVYGKDSPTKASSRRQDAARGVDGGPEHADRNADQPRSN